MTVIEGRARGGKARATSLSKERRTEIAKKASSARWKGDMLLKATHGSEDHPLIIADIKIPCYVLSDGRRVLVQQGMGIAIGYSDTGGQRITGLVESKAMTEYIGPELLRKLNNPIEFKTPQGIIAKGYDATILVDICDAVLAARKDGRLSRQQEHIALKCEILIRGFAKVGIIALIDEATGYQDSRTRDALARILEQYVTKELRPWVKKFPPLFYQQLCRLRDVEFSSDFGDKPQLPQYFGHLTNDIIYKRLAPGIWKALKSKVEKDNKGRPKHKLHQFLTPEIGDPNLRDLISSVTTVMELSTNWDDFKEKLDKIRPLIKNEIVEKN
jgi:hypothetical protein